MATETVQTTQIKQPGKQEFKEEVKGKTDDGSTFEVKHEVKVESKPESPVDNPFARVATAESIVHRNVLWSLGAGLLPLPLLDIAAVTAVEVKMLKELSDLCGVGFRSEIAKKLIYSLLSGLGSVGIGGAVGFSLSKLIPGIGTTFGLISIPLFAGAFTHALGRIFVMHFESGGTLLDFDPHGMRSHFKQEFEKAKVAVGRMQKEQKEEVRVTATKTTA